MKGTIKFYNAEKGYGFIGLNGEPDLYFNNYGVKNPAALQSWKKNQEVDFNMGTSKEGRPKALNVIIHDNAN